jgi:branched-chain amino acid transport system permease protein
LHRAVAICGKRVVLSPTILIPAILNGLMTGAVYALVALGLTLIYGVLHIINFAHGALLTAAMFAAYFAYRLGIDPYLAVFIIAPLFFGLGYGLQRFVIGPASHGDDRNMLLVTLGLAVVIENALLFAFRADTRTIDVPYAFQSIDFGFTFIAVPRLIGFIAVFAVAFVLWLIMGFTDIGRAIRAVAKEKLGAFTIVVLGGMGSVPGALIGGLVIGVVESLSSLFLGESLGQIGIFLIFIIVLLLRPRGLFGATA